jgi:hypothetical protein
MGRYLNTFSTGTEKGDISGFSGIGPGTGGGKGARIGLILPEGNLPSFLRLPDEKKRGQNPIPVISPTIPGAVARYG